MKCQINMVNLVYVAIALGNVHGKTFTRMLVSSVELCGLTSPLTLTQYIVFCSAYIGFTP